MTEEVTDPQNQTAETQVTEQPTADPIDDIISRYKIEETASQFEPRQPTTERPAPQVEPAKPSIPDPYDTDNFRAYMAQREAGNAALQEQLKTVTGFLSHMQAEQIKQKVEGDIKSAVKAVDDVAGLGKPKLIEAYLDSKVREDSRLKAIWDNRDKNPKALQEALKHVGKEMAEEFSVRTDPKLVEAQRARRAAQSQQATTKNESPDEAIEAEIASRGFDAFWNSLKGDMN